VAVEIPTLMLRALQTPAAHLPLGRVPGAARRLESGKACPETEFDETGAQ
jgi:hypothetical protein